MHKSPDSAVFTPKTPNNQCTRKEAFFLFERSHIVLHYQNVNETMIKQTIYFEGMQAEDFFNQLGIIVKRTIIEITTKPPDPTERMSIQQVCTYHEISDQTLRNWDKIGKLKPASEPEAIHKYYLRGEVMAVPKKGKRYARNSGATACTISR